MDDKNGRGCDISSCHSFRSDVQDQNMGSYLRHNSADRASVAYSSRLYRRST
ncbi:hypothetical protein PSV08DRAFT_276867 [Bipolaris maydis]|uniref:uncharacterized protein n=1 Tax=Cochliobolus heterostrophus TaxID=5016 RepID=UPI0024D5FC61|nr:hypothetical protein J3E73DRAFT_266515 [Bipolaris maydis]KAJ6273783.1 hypothetical protein PSV08DRAFT_276867 [Bipolaris maydis]